MKVGIAVGWIDGGDDGAAVVGSDEGSADGMGDGISVRFAQYASQSKSVGASEIVGADDGGGNVGLKLVVGTGAGASVGAALGVDVLGAGVLGAGVGRCVGV